MKVFKVYVKKKPLEYGKLVSNLELKLTKISKDLDGAYLLFTSLNGVEPENIKAFKGVKKVYAFNSNFEKNNFKVLINPNKKISYEKMIADFELSLKEIGTSSKTNFWNKQYPFMIFESENYIHPDQLTRYKNVKSVELITEFCSLKNQ